MQQAIPRAFDTLRAGRRQRTAALHGRRIERPDPFARRNPWSRLVGVIRTERSPQTSATGAYMPWTFVKSSPEPLTVQPSNRISPVQPMKCVASAMVLKTRPDRSSAHDVEADHRDVVRTDAEDAAA